MEVLAMSNIHERHLQSHTNIQSMLQSSRHARNDPLSLNEYVMPDARHQGLDNLLQSSQSTYKTANLSIAAALSPYPAFTPSFQNTARDNAPNFDTSRDSYTDSPNDRQGSLGLREKKSFSGISHAHGSATSVSAVYMGRTRSVGGSSETSRTSSREVTARRPEESFGFHETGVEDSNSGYDVNTESRGFREHPPPWSELKTKAGKERKRLPLACIACRRKKIRCSGEKPACKHCLRSRLPCVYKVTARKAAPRTDYMAMLDKRLRRMEDRVIKIVPKDGAKDLAAIGRANVKPGHPGHSAKGDGSKKRTADEAFGTDLDDWSSADTNRGLRPPDQSSEVREVEESRLLTEGADRLPSKEVQGHLAEVFFDCVYGQSYHLLHKPSFMRKLRAGTVPPVLTLAVCAISARFSTHPQLASEPAFLRGECWAAPAREISLERYDRPNITILTVLLILGLHEFGTCQGGRSWMLGGMAMRMAYALQLHQELDRESAGRKNHEETELSCTDREIRRRTMWACFLMDRFNSSGTERPTFANEETINVQLPIKEAHFRMELPGSTERLEANVYDLAPSDGGHISNAKNNMGVAAYMIRVIALWGRVIKYLNLGGKERDPYPIWSPDSHFTRLEAQAEDFSSSLPTHLHYTTGNLKNHAAERLANQFLFMHICYHQVNLFLHRFAIPSISGRESLKEMPKAFVSEAWNVAINAAKQISGLISVAEEHQVTAPFAGYCAFLSSTVHIWGIFSKNVELEASSKRDLAHNVKYLSKMRKYWGMFHFMTENLKDIYRHHADAALQGTTAHGSTAHGTGVFQYGDWFTKYPHGVSRTDYEDPVAEVKKEPGNDAVLSQKSDLQSVEAFFASKSPTSHVEHQRKSAKVKPKNTVNVTQQQVVPSNNRDTGATPQAMRQHLAMAFSPQNQNQGLDAAFPHSHAPEINHQQQHFPPGYCPPELALSHPPRNTLPQLDRHLVYGAYAGHDPTTNVLPNSSTHPSEWDDLHLTGYTPGFIPEPTSAWFMPFNIEPPEINGEDPFVGGINNIYHMHPPHPPP